MFFIPLARTTATTRQEAWVRLARVGEARQEVAVAQLDGKIYLIGGIGSRVVSATVEVYDPKTDRWSFVAPLPEPLHHTTAASLDGFVYVVGGYDTLAFTPVDSAYRYDPRTNEWTRIARLPSRRGALALVALNGKLYAVGGEGDFTTGELGVYDPATNRWALLASMPTPREHIAAGAVNGRLYVAGGRRPGNFTLNTLEEYDPATDTWRGRAPMPTGRSGIAGTVAGGRFYVFGGEGNVAVSTGVFAQNESYDPTTNTWRTETPMPVPRHGIGAATLDGHIHIPGGAPVQGFGLTDIHDAFVAVPPPVNQPPRIEAIAGQHLRGGTRACVEVRVSDPEGDAVTVSCAADNPAFASCAAGSPPTVCLNPSPADEGDFTVRVMARDTSGNEARASFVVTVFVNHAPVFEAVADVTLFEGESKSVAVRANDSDAGRDPTGDGKLSLGLLDGPNFIKFNDDGSGRGTVFLTPAAGDGNPEGKRHAVTIEARDAGNPPLGTTAGFSVIVKSRDAPPPSPPVVSTAVYRAKALTVTGLRLGPSPQVEINAAVVAGSLITDQGETRIVLTGKRKTLGLKSGENVIVVTVAGRRSEPFRFTVGR